MNFQLKMNYKTEKLIKKAYGKHLGRQIALGRLLLKVIKKNYGQYNCDKKNLIHSLHKG